MILIQQLKEPKETSGTRLNPGESVQIKNISIHNANEFPVYINSYRRKRHKKPLREVRRSKKKISTISS
jgi:hypothetical protein